MIDNVYVYLDNTRRALARLRQAPDVDHFRSAFFDVTTSGRQVTLAMQKAFRSTAPWFEDWYSEEQEAMKADPLLQWFLRAQRDRETRRNRGPGLLLPRPPDGR